jgi:hypothetical protein
MYLHTWRFFLIYPVVCVCGLLSTKYLKIRKGFKAYVL